MRDLGGNVFGARVHHEIRHVGGERGTLRRRRGKLCGCCLVVHVLSSHAVIGAVAVARLRLAASRAARRTACSSAPVFALPLPTMSKAVPCAGVVKTVFNPAVTVTPRLKPCSLVAICPWS